MPLPYVTLILSGLLVSLGPLLSVHRHPQTVFYNEWLSALLLALGLVMAASSRRTLHTASPGAAVIFGLLVVLGLLAVTGGGGYAAYIGLALAAYLYACGASAEHGGRRLVCALAGGLLLGATAQCAVSGFQLAGMSLGGLVMPKLYNAVYGNIAQPNHFGNLLWLAQAGLIYLWGTRRLEPWLALLLSLTISLFAAMSASRAVWLYTALLPLLCCAFAWRRQADPVTRLMAQASLVVGTISLLAQVLFAYTGLSSLLGVVSSASRAGDASSNGQRLFDWVTAWQTGLAYPWSGGGAGSFAWQTALQAVGLTPGGFIRIGENAHNTPLHLLAEFGWPVTLLLCGGVSLWLLRRWLRASSPEALWGFMVLAVIGAHSMVEYPLWYAYFIIPAGLAMGVIASSEEGASLHRMNGRFLWMPAVVLAVGLAWTMRDYRLLDAAYARLPYGAEASERSFAEARVAGTQISNWSLFVTHARSLEIRAWPPALKESAGEVAGLCDRFLSLKPNFQTLTQCAYAFAETGQAAQAEQATLMVCGAYPAMYHGRFFAEMLERFAANGWEAPPALSCRN